VDYDAIAAELAAALLGGNSTLGNSTNTAGSAGIGRRLLQSQDMVLCNALLNMFNVSASELGNGFCNHGPWNTVACGFDGGDCCEVTCNQPDMGNSTLEFSCAPLGLACRDPVAIGECWYAKTDVGTCKNCEVTPCGQGGPLLLTTLCIGVVQLPSHAALHLYDSVS
jgi:hypothetical protein